MLHRPLATLHVSLPEQLDLPGVRGDDCKTDEDVGDDGGFHLVCVSVVAGPRDELKEEGVCGSELCVGVSLIKSKMSKAGVP